MLLTVSSSATEDAVLVAGGGIAGFAIVAALHKVGIKAFVLERQDAARTAGAGIGLWPNAFRALDALGVAAPLREAHQQTERIEFCKGSADSLLSSLAMDTAQESRVVLRSGLLECLVSAVPKESVYYGRRVTKAWTEGDRAVAELDGGEQLAARAVVGADGVHSALAAALGAPPANYAGYAAIRGLAHTAPGQLEAEIPPGLLRQVLGQSGVRLGMVRSTPTRIYWFLVDPGFQGSSRLGTAEKRERVTQLGAGMGHIVKELAALTPDEDLSFSKLFDRWLAPGRTLGKGLVTLAGDALHPTTPNLGQGGCMALEDAIALAQRMRALADGCGSDFTGVSSSDLAAALREYERARLGRALPIVLKSNAIGAIMRLRTQPLAALRDAYISSGLMSTTAFLSHTTYDCGTL